MSASSPKIATVFLLLALLLAATRINHFGALPDASWAVFFIAGFYLSKQMRWVFPGLMALAVAVDYFVISNSGINFWTHYCVSPGYWFLLPAHFAMWMGGAALTRLADRSKGLALAALAPSLLLAVVLCHLFAQGGFYWFSSHWFAEGATAATLAGWWKNYTDWLPAYLTTAAIYVGVASVMHIGWQIAFGRRESAAQPELQTRPIF